MSDPVRLTQYCRSAGCGCKLAPHLLDQILSGNGEAIQTGRLLVGNHSRDDAAVYKLDHHQALISTTDFFMPIVDDPFDFGKIASVNAISDVYAMGGRPQMAVAILAWPSASLSSETARRVLEGGRAACASAGIPLAGGHSIDASEPVFGLAVSGIVQVSQLKRNNTAEPGCFLFLTKPLGVGLVATAHKHGCVDSVDLKRAIEQMTILNSLGASLSSLSGVKAMTDVTGFGLLGHLMEMCTGSGVSAVLDFGRVPLLENIDRYVDQEFTSGGTDRNFKSYGHNVNPLTKRQKALLCDPQTSGGLLVAVAPDALQAFGEMTANLALEPIGRIIEPTNPVIVVNE